MRKWVAGLVALMTLIVLAATDIAAQEVETIMRARERLELTEDQLEGLEALRRETVQERAAERAQREELRSQLDAGQIERSEVMAFMEERRELRQERTQQLRERVEAVLTESQLESLEQMRRPSRVRSSARPGGRPGLDGPGFAPRGRAGLRGPQGLRRGPPRAAPRAFRDRGAFGGRDFVPPRRRG